MQNDMRNRLIRRLHDWGITGVEELADYLIANYVIVLPCKVGDTVYLVRGKCNCNKAVCLENGGIGITRCEIEPCDAYIKEVPFSLYLFNGIGKTVFLTKEQAEQKLKELNGND